MESLGADGKGTATGGCRNPCVGKNLSGGGSSGSVVLIVNVGHVRSDDKDGRENPYTLNVRGRTSNMITH